MCVGWSQDDKTDSQLEERKIEEISAKKATKWGTVYINEF